MLDTDLVMVQLNCGFDIGQSGGSFFGDGPVFDGDLGHFFLQKDWNMLDFDSFCKFGPFKEVDVGPCLANFLFSRKRLNDMEFEGIKQHFIENLVNFFVSRTHRLQVDLVIVGYPCFSDLLIPFRKNVIWILLKLLVEDFDSFLFGGVASLRLLEQERTNSVFSCV